MKEWELDPVDMKAVEGDESDEVVLQAIPKKLYVEMETPMKKAYPGLPKKWFPLTPSAYIGA